ncbi:enoyl-CoA hydratase/isomerase family protein, partial [Psychrobacter sp. T6-1]
LCNGSDAMFTSLAEYAVAGDDYDKVISLLTQTDWQPATTLNQSSLDTVTSQALAAYPVADLPESKLALYWQSISQIMNRGGLGDIDDLLRDDDALAQIDGNFAADKWTKRALATYRHGCPVSAALTYALYDKATDLSLEQVLYLELNTAVHCAANPDFKEGVRALLIDKDKDPK